MAGRNYKMIKKLKKQYVWSGLFTTFILTMIMCVLLMLIASIAFQYSIDTWISSEYDRVTFMSGLYDIGEDPNAYGLGGKEYVYIITDRDGNVIRESGKNTCSGTGYQVDVMDDNGVKSVMIYPDNTVSLITVDEDRLTLNLVYLFNLAMSPGGVKNLMENDTLAVPIWIGKEAKSGSEVFIVRSDLVMSSTDIMFFSIIVSSVLVLIGLIFLILLIKIITGIAHQRKLNRVFFNDEVTGGNNWTYFRMKGEQILKKHSSARTRFAVLDVVFVKYRNYCVCHSVEEGENMLREVLKVLERNLKKGEICGHYASANFTALFNANDAEYLKARLGNIISQLESIDAVHKIAFHIGVDFIEIARDRNGNVIRRPEVSLENEYNNACAARATLEESDDSGIAYFDEKLVEEQRWIDAVQERQLRALNNEEYVVYYQPKYNPVNDKLTGAEALIRWISPEFGFVPPGKIIPIFEKNGFITEIDHYMIRHVARDQKMWHDQGLNCVPVSVNVSRAHFIEDNLAEQIRDIVDEEGAPHELIEIELTESAFFDDKKALVNTINKLKSYGFAVSMDDFGSGYSSLNSLKDLPLDVLKLDAEFFRGSAEGDRQEVVISETIRLAQALNMRTVAEGVEVREQVDFLAKQGCDMIQGYYYAKPMPKEEYVQRMGGQNTDETL